MTLAIGDVGIDERGLAPLLDEGIVGDGLFLLRLREDWASGVCRFDRAGEFLLAAFADNALVGIGGVSLDPYHPADGLGRVRHVYVSLAHRRRGIGRAVMAEIVARARAVSSPCVCERCARRRPASTKGSASSAATRQARRTGLYSRDPAPALRH